MITFFTMWLSSSVSFLAAGPGADALLSAPVSTFLEGTTVLSGLLSFFLSSALSALVSAAFPLIGFVAFAAFAGSSSLSSLAAFLASSFFLAANSSFSFFLSAAFYAAEPLVLF